MTTRKVKLLRTVLLPVEGSRTVAEHFAGETVEVSSDIAERFIRIGAAEKAK